MLFLSTFCIIYRLWCHNIICPSVSLNSFSGCYQFLHLFESTGFQHEPFYSVSRTELVFEEQELCCGTVCVYEPGSAGSCYFSGVASVGSIFLSAPLISSPKKHLSIEKGVSTAGMKMTIQLNQQVNNK